MFHGYDKEYDQNDVLLHIQQLDVSKEALDWLLTSECDENGDKLTREKVFTKVLPAQFIHTRKMLLGSLLDGLTIGECHCNSETDLEKGCGLARELFSLIPMEAIKTMYFAKPFISLDDLLAIIQPVYGVGGECL